MNAQRTTLTRAMVLLVMCLLQLGARSLRADPQPVYYEGFESGKIDGPVGKAGARVGIDAEGIVDLSRGSFAFFVQSAQPPVEKEWFNVGGVTTTRDAGYWTMAALLQIRMSAFCMSFFDAGAYAPPMELPAIIGRWEAGEWHHLAVVWDRRQGVRVYEDGKEIGSNWGDHQWAWSLIASRFSVAGPVDEVYVFADPLTPEQVAQLANGQKPTGAVLPMLPVAERREQELARFGYSQAMVDVLPRVTPEAGVRLTFTRIAQVVDSKRPIAQLHEGLVRSPWPSLKYGASTRGQRAELTIDDEGGFDRVRVFSLRPFTGQLARPYRTHDEPLLPIATDHQGYWHARLDEPVTGDHPLVLLREQGMLGQIDLYRAEPLGGGKVDGTSYSFAPAEAFPETTQGRILQATHERATWNPVAMQAAGNDAPASLLATEAFSGFQAFAAPEASGTLYGGARVSLVVEGLAEPTPVHIEIAEPVDPERVWLAADVVLVPAGTSSATYTVELRGRPVAVLPDMQKFKYIGNGRHSDELVPLPGTGFSVSVMAASPAKWKLGAGGSHVTFIPSDDPDALAKAADDQIEFMREAYAERMEGHLYGDPRIILPLTWLAKYAPDRMEVRQMWHRVDANAPKSPELAVEPFVYLPPVNDSGAPDWAFYQMVATDRIREHLHWMVDEKQIWTGEYGGIWNDDADHIENWMGYILALDGSGKIKASLDEYWHGQWNFQLTEGVGRYTQDAGHYAEEGSSNLGMKLLVDYGDPIAYTWAMLSGRHFPLWTAEVEPGKYVWKSFYTGPEGAWTQGAFLKNQPPRGHELDPLVPLNYLIWYNRHPQAGKWMAGVTAGAPFGLHGVAVLMATDEANMASHYREALTNPDYARSLSGEGLAGIINEIGVTPEMKERFAKPYAPLDPLAHYWGSKATDDHWVQWKLTGDARYLVDSYQRVAEWFLGHDWLNSAAMPSMDRNPLPRGAVIRSRLGALVANRGGSGVMWPRHAISFQQGGDQVASLVTENLPNRAAVKLYPFVEGEHALRIAAWRCHGTFTVALAQDSNDDGVGESVYWEKEMKLDRGMPIDLVLPGRQVSLLTITPVEVTEPDYDLADPAISRGTVELVYGDHLVVHVYNIGRKPVDDVLVRVRDGASGKIVVNGEAHTGPIEAPLDMEPRHRMVEFKNVNASALDRLIIEIDPDGAIEDFNRHNNRVILDYRGTFTLHGGWE